MICAQQDTGQGCEGLTPAACDWWDLNSQPGAVGRTQ